MLTFVCWKWREPGSNRRFESEHVNVLRAMIARHYPEPHKLVCITDETSGLDSRVEAFPMPSTGFEGLINPHLQNHRERLRKWCSRSARVKSRLRPPSSDKHFPSCYRRLWLFSKEACVLGPRIFLLDIDVIIAASLLPLTQHDADFVGWCDSRFAWQKIAGGGWLLRTGTRTDVWTQFDPRTSPAIAAAAGNKGSDQAWISYKLFPPAYAWSSADGVVKLNWLGQFQTKTPAGARLVFTGGHVPPWHREVQRRYPWIKQHWTL